MKKYFYKWMALVMVAAVLFSFVLPHSGKAATNTLANGEYTVTPKFLTDGTNESSVMNQYIESPAILIVKDGKKYINLTLNNKNWITDFKVEVNGKLVKPTELSSNSKTNKIIMQFEVKDLSEKLDAWVKVDFDTPISYHHSYDVQLVFDTPKPRVTVKTVSDTSTKVSGTTVSGATVKMYLDGELQDSMKANKNTGSYAFKIKKQKAGTKIKVTSKDSRKITGSKTVTVVDKTAPKTPTVNKVTNKSTSVSGKTEKKATVYIYNNKKRLGSEKADNKGNYKIKIKKQKSGTKLTVYAKDQAGNQSSKKTIKVQ